MIAVYMCIHIDTTVPERGHCNLRRAGESRWCEGGKWRKPDDRTCRQFERQWATVHAAGWGRDEAREERERERIEERVAQEAEKAIQLNCDNSLLLTVLLVLVFVCSGWTDTRHFLFGISGVCSQWQVTNKPITRKVNYFCRRERERGGGRECVKQRGMCQLLPQWTNSWCMCCGKKRRRKRDDDDGKWDTDTHTQGHTERTMMMQRIVQTTPGDVLAVYLQSNLTRYRDNIQFKICVNMIRVRGDRWCHDQSLCMQW